jgi:hypothetical protein
VTSRALITGVGFAGALALAAARAQTADPGGRALLERQQQSDAFALQLQQWTQRQRASGLAPRDRQALESLHHDQQLRQSESFYRQQAQQLHTQHAAPPESGLRQAEMKRFEQDRLQDLSRWRWQAAHQAPAPESPQISSGSMRIAPHGHSAAQMPQPLQ